MRIARLSGVITAALSAVAVAGCAAGTKSATAPHPAPTTTTTNVVALEMGELTVTPSMDLQDAQQVTASVKGFPPSRKFYLSECLTPSGLTDLGCGAQLAAQPFGVSDANGNGSTTFTVRSAASGGALIRTVQACTGRCVIVATAGAGGPFYFAPVTFAPPSVAAAGAPPCTNGHITVSDTGGGGAGGHEDQVLVFTNEGPSSCTLFGYPGVAGLNSEGQQAVQAHRSPGGYMGGLLPGITTFPVVSLAPGQTASAVVEGTDNPIDARPCPYYPALLVTPPNLTKGVQVQVSDLGSQGFPDCSGIEVHPVVPGASGSSPGF